MRRETRMNDDIRVQHMMAAKIASAVWGDRHFGDPVPPVKLLEENNTAASRNEKVLRTLKAKGLI